MTELHIAAPVATLAADDNGPVAGIADALGEAVGGVLVWTADRVPGGMLSVLGVLAALAWLMNESSKGKTGQRAGSNAKGGQSQGVREAEAAGAFLGGAGRVLGRFFTGRPLTGRATEAKWFSPAPRTISDDVAAVPMAQLGSVGLETVPAGPTLHERTVDRIGEWPRWVGLPVSVLWTLLRSQVLSVRTVGRLARSWPRWARLPRLVVTVALVAVPALWWADYGTSRALIIATAFTGSAAFVGLAITGPHGFALWHGYQPGDDERYAPALWFNLSASLGLPEEAYREEWLDFPRDLSAEDATIVCRLPLTFVGTDADKVALTALLEARVPGQWTATWQTYGANRYVRWNRRVIKPKPQPPAAVDFLAPDVQVLIDSLAPGDLLVGLDAYARPLIKSLSGETSHWAVSIGSGGGKSSFLSALIAQLSRRSATIVAPDVKMVSLDAFEGLPGVHIYNDPENVQDMRAAIKWVREEAKARTYVRKTHKNRAFRPLVLVLEEGNEFGALSKEWWDENKPDGAKAGDAIWGDVASIMRLGRHVNVHVIAVFQDLDERAFGNKGLRTLFNLIFMGSYSPQQWKKIINRTPVPELPKKAGRIIAVEGPEDAEFQAPYTEPDDFRAYVADWRKHTGFNPEADLYGKPPGRSVMEVPALLKGTEYADETPRHAVTSDGHAGPSEGGSTDRPAGGRVTAPAAVTPARAGRDALSLTKGNTAPQGPADVEDGPQRLPLAEIARRLEVDGIGVAASTMRQHKRRNTDFPAGIEKNGQNLYTEDEIRAYYTAREKNG